MTALLPINRWLTAISRSDAGRERKRWTVQEYALPQGQSGATPVLTHPAKAVSHCKKGYLQAFFYRVKACRGWAKAIVATAHKILLIASTKWPLWT